MWFETSEYITNGYKIGGLASKIILLKRGIYIDTGPLFLLIAGYYDKIRGRKLIQKFNYNKLDYKCLIAFLSSLKLHNYSLLITPHIFTEFMSHLWEKSESPTQFKEVLEISFKTRWFMKDTDIKIGCFDFLREDALINKELEIGDISICICAKEGKKEKGKPITILTDDVTFAEIADKKYNFLSIYYQEIKTSTLLLKIKNIPKELLIDPIKN